MLDSNKSHISHSEMTATGVQKTHLDQILLNGNNVAMVGFLSSHSHPIPHPIGAVRAWRRGTIRIADVVSLIVCLASAVATLKIWTRCAIKLPKYTYALPLNVR